MAWWGVGWRAEVRGAEDATAAGEAVAEARMVAVKGVAGEEEGRGVASVAALVARKAAVEAAEAGGAAAAMATWTAALTAATVAARAVEGVAVAA